MNRYITLPCLYHNSTTMKQLDCGIDFKLSDCHVKEVHFFELGNLTEIWEDGTEYAQLMCHGQYYYSTLTCFYILDLIDKTFSSEFIYYDN